MQSDRAKLLRAYLVCNGLGYLLQRITVADQPLHKQVIQRKHLLLLLAAAVLQGLLLAQQLWGWASSAMPISAPWPAGRGLCQGSRALTLGRVTGS
jgi:hypothetical protein